MTPMDTAYLFSPALPAELDGICALIDARIAWMDEVGLRLDCARDNDALNAYYASFGFRPVGTVTDGPYEGTLRELSLN